MYVPLFVFCYLASVIIFAAHPRETVLVLGAYLIWKVSRR